MPFNQRLAGINYQSKDLVFTSDEHRKEFYAALGYAIMWGSEGIPTDTVELVNISIDKNLHISAGHYPKAEYKPTAPYTGSPGQAYDAAIKSMIEVTTGPVPRAPFFMQGLPSDGGKYSFHS